MVCIGRCQCFLIISRKEEKKKKNLTATYPAYPLCSQTSRKLEKFMTLSISGIQYYRAMFNFMDIQFHERVDAYVGVGADDQKVNVSQIPCLPAHTVVYREFNCCS